MASVRAVRYRASNTGTGGRHLASTHPHAHTLTGSESVTAGHGTGHGAGHGAGHGTGHGVGLIDSCTHESMRSQLPRWAHSHLVVQQHSSLHPQRSESGRAAARRRADPCAPPGPLWHGRRAEVVCPLNAHHRLAVSSATGGGAWRPPPGAGPWRDLAGSCAVYVE